MIWIVIYQVNTGFVYGWVCRAAKAAEAEEQFWESMIMTQGRTIKCIAQLPSEIIDPYFSLYEEEPRDER
jgi:hypothetical protein